MRKISEQELKDILDKHGKWLRNEEGGERADLSSADLRSADLSWADLRSADLVLFQFNRDQAFFTKDGMLRIGCIFMPISEWLIGYEEIAKRHGYTEIETQAYGDFIKSCAKLFDKWNPPHGAESD